VSITWMGIARLRSPSVHMCAAATSIPLLFDSEHVKTIELILGLPAMSLFDMIAEDMRHSFQAETDPTPFKAVDPIISLFDLNPRVQALGGSEKQAAIASSKMRFDIPDAAPQNG